MKPKTVGRGYGVTPVEPSKNEIELSINSIILTLDGEMRVGDICSGQRIITRNCGSAIVTSVARHRKITNAVLIRAGSLGQMRPDRDVVLPASQGVLVRGLQAQEMCGTAMAVIPAMQLIDGHKITDLGAVELALFKIGFDAAHILYIDGLEVAGHVKSATHAKAA